MMQDSVYSLARRCLRKYVEAFVNIIPKETKVISSIEIENTFSDNRNYED